MKYDERACKLNMDTGCVELLLRDGRKISIDCTGVEDALDVTMAHGSTCVCRILLRTLHRHKTPCPHPHRSAQ